MGGHAQHPAPCHCLEMAGLPSQHPLGGSVWCKGELTMSDDDGWPPVGYVSPIDPAMQAFADQLRDQIEREQRAESDQGGTGQRDD